MMDPDRFSMAEILPHDDPMILIDELLKVDFDSAISRAVIKSDCLLLDSTGKAPAAIGIEWMAQTIAAHAGYKSRSAGEPIAIGYLLGARHYSSTRNEFYAGEEVEVAVVESFKDEKIAAYNCRILQDSTIIARATVTVYQPD